MKIGFTGTQVGMTERQKLALREKLMLPNVEEFHHGCCIGADEEAHAIARSIGIHIVGHPPDNTKKMAVLDCDEVRPPKAYLDRNHDIVDEVDFMLGAPKSLAEELYSGTWATIRYSRKVKRPGVILWP